MGPLKYMDKELFHWAEAQAQLFQVLTNPRRVLILRVLAEREMSVGEISALVGTSMQNTSQHLRLMKERGFLNSRRDGQTIYYGIADLPLLHSIDLLTAEKFSKTPQP
jgi:ArsR family transcriptional regulator, virulence genes transcriptional regulator